MIIKQQNQGFVEDNLSNLTSPISGEASVSSSSKQSHVFPHQIDQQFHQQLHHSDDDDHEHPPAKKKRNLPGNPDPESEVIALSPRTLQATNRFICEICNKGFQRDQNLQLHRRGHNLPWKLKQRSKTEVVKKKVYVCPEQTCVHHHPSRALGDLTGIKKHFSRKHCDKKWKCDKCSKRYAVHSDWKAHSKVCGTREYRCDCGTLFSRRDSFITHRAFCDALAEETARAITTTISSSVAQTTNTQFMNDNCDHHLHATFPLKIEQQQHHLPPWLACPPIPSPPSSSSSVFQPQDQNPKNPNTAVLLPAFMNTAAAVSVPSSHMSATALLQKAAQMEATMSITTSAHHHQNHHGHVADNNVPNETCTTGMFGLDVSTSSSFNHDMYDGAFGVEGMGMKNPFSTFRQTPGGSGGGDKEGMTRDFLGLKPLIQNDIFTLAALGNCMTSNVVSTTTTTTSNHNYHQQETHKQWQN